MKDLEERVARDKARPELFGGRSDKQIYDGHYFGLIKTVAEPRDRIYNDPALYAKALAELERRKIANLETLKGYGLEIG